MTRLTRRTALRRAAIGTGIIVSSTRSVSATDDTFAGGNGSRSDPYLIDSNTGLRSVVADPAAHYELISDLDLSGTRPFEPIGLHSDPFTGSLDGGGHTIRGLEVDVDSEEWTGMFATVDDATIERLRLVDAHVGSGPFTGGLVGHNDGGTISQCVFQGAISGGGLETAGLAGVNAGTVADSYAFLESDSHLGALTSRNSGEVLRSYAVGSSDDSSSDWITDSSDSGVDGVYWDSAVSPNARSRSGETGLPTPLMTGNDARDAMTEFDFNTTWETTEGYPRLAWQDTGPPAPEPTPGFLVVDHAPGDIEIDAGDPVTVSTTVENVGSEPGTATVALSFSGNVDGPGSAGRQESRSVDLDPGESTSIEFDPIETDDVVDGEYTYTVQTDHTEDGASVVVEDGPTERDLWIDEGALQVPAEEDVTISGGTDFQDAESLRLRVRSADSVAPRFVFTSDISITDGRWTTEVSFDMASPGDEFSANIRGAGTGETYIDTQGEVVDPAMVFDVDEVVLSDADTGDRLARAVDGEWVDGLPEIPPDETLSVVVNVRDDGEPVLNDNRVRIDVETGDGTSVTVDDTQFDLTPDESGTTTVSISVLANEEERYRSPPLSVTGAEEPDSTDDTESEEDGEEGTDDTDGEGDTDDTDGGDADDTDEGDTDDTDDEGETSGSDEESDVVGSVPGFTLPSTVATIGGAAYALSRQFGRREDEDETGDV